MRRIPRRYLLLAARTSGLALLILVLALFAVYAVDWGRTPGVGSVWVYQASQTSGAGFTETETLSGVELCGLRVCLVYNVESDEGTTTQWITRDWILMQAFHVDKEGNSQFVTYRNGLQLYKVPLQLGDSWTWDTPATRTVTIKETERGTTVVRTEEFTVYAERRVVGVERVSVPAGEYSAFVIEHFDQHGTIRQKVWFSADAGEAVRYVSGFFSIYRTLWELREYSHKSASLFEFFQLSAGFLKPLPILVAGVALVLISSSQIVRRLKFFVLRG